MQTNPALVPLAYDDQHNCFGCGAHNRSGMKLRFFHAPEGGVQARLKLARRFQGPHGFVHGGVISSLLDEAMSKAIHATPRSHAIMAVTRTLETEYLRPTPLGALLTLHATEDRVEGRKHFCSGTVSDADGHILASGKALFIAISRLPEHKH